MESSWSGDSAGAISKTVLVVEDDLSVIQLLEFHLVDAGYRVLSARSVGEAWRSVQDDPPDGVLVDVHLPGAFGWELVERLRTDRRFHRIPTIIMSGEITREDRQRGQSLGAALVMKPFEPQDIVAALTEQMEETRTLPMTSVEAVIFLNGYRVSGIIHISREFTRVSDGVDSLMRDQRALIPMTQVTIYGGNDSVVATAEFLQVSKKQVQLVLPKQDAMEPYNSHELAGRRESAG